MRKIVLTFIVALGYRFRLWWFSTNRVLWPGRGWMTRDCVFVKNVTRVTELLAINSLAVFYVTTMRPVIDSRKSRTGRTGRFFWCLTIYIYIGNSRAIKCTAILKGIENKALSKSRWRASEGKFWGCFSEFPRWEFSFWGCFSEFWGCFSDHGFYWWSDKGLVPVYLL